LGEATDEQKSAWAKVSGKPATFPPSGHHASHEKGGADEVLVMPGMMMDWPTETVPAGWLERNGASLLREDYAALFAVIGTMYGAADGTHFNLMDDRGRFGRWWANGHTTDPDRATRTAPAVTGATLTAGDHVGTEQAEGFKSHTHPLRKCGEEASDYGLILTTAFMDRVLVEGLNGSTITDYKGGNETRPLNRNYMPIIKY